MAWTKAQDLYKLRVQVQDTKQRVWLLLQRVEQHAPATPMKFSDVPCPAMLQRDA